MAAELMVERDPKRSSNDNDAVPFASAGPCMNAIGSKPAIQAANPNAIADAATANVAPPTNGLPRRDRCPAMLVLLCPIRPRFGAQSLTAPSGFHRIRSISGNQSKAYSRQGGPPRFFRLPGRPFGPV